MIGLEAVGTQGNCLESILFCLSLHTNKHLSPENSERAGPCYFLFSGLLYSILVFGPNQSESVENATEAPSTADIVYLVLCSIGAAD